MKTLCFTSVSSRDLALCARIFHQAGMATPRAASNRAGLDIHGWHEQVLSANTRDSFQPVTEPGTFHVQLASDIFIANMEQALWGWQSVTNTFFLDFWQRFDPNIFFVLVCLPPACLVARELESGNNDPDTQQILGTWQIHHQEMLAFYHRHPDRCLCLDSRALFSNPSAAVDLCATTWKLPLEKDRISTPTSLLPDPLAWFLAQQMVTGHDEEAASLWQEVEATVHPLGGEALMDQPGSKAILARYSDLCEHSGKLVKLEADQSKLQEENSKILSQLHHAQEGLEKTCRANQQLETEQQKIIQDNGALNKDKATLTQRISDLDAKTKQLETEKQKIIQDNDALNKDKAALTQRINELDAKTKQLESEKQKLEGKIKDLEEENELLLLQLHQVQEELETTFLKNQKLDDTSNRLEKEKAALEKRINELDAKTKQLESEKQKLAQDNDALNKDKAALTQRTSQLDARTKQLETEKQKLAQDNGALSKDKATLTQRITGLEARTKELETHNQQQKKEIETGGRHAQKIEELENRLRDTSDENELLLLQLHQVQEELEKYFLGNQETQKQLDEIESRWHRLQQRYPAYCDYTDLSIEEHDKTLRWIFNEYLGGGRKIDRLCVDLNLKRNVAGLTLSRENIHDSSPLVYWPKLHQDATSLDLAPNALTREQALALVHTYSQIATSDWLWLQDLGAAMIDHLESDHPALDHIDESLREQFVQGLDLHQEKLESLPPVLRCDAVHLVQEHSANGYEHIWLRLENPHFTNSQCSDFEFRLACVNDSSTSHELGNHPRLEFPDPGDETLFTGWFKESENRFGQNLELRFALPDRMDTDLWARLDQEDAALISSLLEQLPFFLDREKDSLAGLRRHKDEWMDLAKKMAAIHLRWTEHAANAKETA
jgi:uncharacterized protein (DUF3084 family)